VTKFRVIIYCLALLALNAGHVIADPIFAQTLGQATRGIGKISSGIGSWNPNPLQWRHGLKAGVSVSWLNHPEGLNMANDLPTILGGVTNDRKRPLRGAQVGFFTQFAPTRKYDLIFSASTLIPDYTEGTIVSNIGLTAQMESSQDYWNYLQCMVQRDMGAGIKALAGFRWDNTSSQIHVSNRGGSVDDFIVNLYLPFLGVKAVQGSPGSGAQLALLASPITPGSIRFHNWSKRTTDYSISDQVFEGGYMIELNGLFACRLTDSHSFSVKGSWNAVHSVTPTQAALLPGVTEIKWIYDRRAWSIGCQLEFTFN
jgi:hypothetical protein